ncbi:hypothetical protein BH23CHL4_BH23CHL4_11830 [soil metagenome]
MIVPSGIMAEIAHFITKRTGERALVQFLDSNITGAELWYSGENDLIRVRELMTRYTDLPLGYADATVIAAAERNGGRILTFDHRHFGVVARKGTIRILS